MGIRREKDFIIRMTEEMAKMFAAILGLRKNAQPALALEKLSESGADWLGMPKSVLDRLDVTSAARMLVEPRKLRIYARLLREEAEILEEMQRDGAAARFRAITLLEEAGRAGGLSAEDEAELRLLGRTV